MALALRTWMKCDPDLVLPCFIKQTMQATVANHATRGTFNNRDLKPGSRDADVPAVLIVKEAVNVLFPESFPGLIASHLRQRTIRTKRRGIRPLQTPKQQSGR